MAVLQLDLADSPALLFRNAANGGLNLVYRRPDGNVGWVDPQRANGGAHGVERLNGAARLTSAAKFLGRGGVRADILVNDLKDLLAPGAVLARLTASTRKQVIQSLSESLARASGLEPRAVCEAVMRPRACRRHRHRGGRGPPARACRGVEPAGLRLCAAGDARRFPGSRWTRRRPCRDAPGARPVERRTP